MTDSLREQLAALAHEQWSGWMRYLFEQTLTFGTKFRVAIPPWAVDRWKRQMATPYAELSEEEKESDRKEADRVLVLLQGHCACLPGKACEERNVAERRLEEVTRKLEREKAFGKHAGARCDELATDIISLKARLEEVTRERDAKEAIASRIFDVLTLKEARLARAEAMARDCAGDILKEFPAWARDWWAFWIESTKGPPQLLPANVRMPELKSEECSCNPGTVSPDCPKHGPEWKL